MAFMRDLRTATTCRSEDEAGAEDLVTVFSTERWGSEGGTLGDSGGHESTGEVCCTSLRQLGESGEAGGGGGGGGAGGLGGSGGVSS